MKLIALSLGPKIKRGEDNYFYLLYVDNVVEAFRLDEKILNDVVNVTEVRFTEDSGLTVEKSLERMRKAHGSLSESYNEEA